MVREFAAVGYREIPAAVDQPASVQGNDRKDSRQEDPFRWDEVIQLFKQVRSQETSANLK